MENMSEKELEWYDFVDRKARYIGGVVVMNEGGLGLSKGVITDMYISNDYFIIKTERPEFSHSYNKRWKPSDKPLNIGANIKFCAPPKILKNGVAMLYIVYCGTVEIYPPAQKNIDYSKCELILESGKPDKNGHIYSVQSCELLAEENGYHLEYLPNGEVRLWKA